MKVTPRVLESVQGRTITTVRIFDATSGDQIGIDCHYNGGIPEVGYGDYVVVTDADGNDKAVNIIQRKIKFNDNGILLTYTVQTHK